MLQAGHLTNCGTLSSNHERPHSQRILYRRCTVTVPHSSSWTSIPLSVAVPGSATLGSTRGSCGKVPGSVVRSFTTKSLTAWSVSHALVAFPTAAYLTRCATADDASLPSVARRETAKARFARANLQRMRESMGRYPPVQRVTPRLVRFFGFGLWGPDSIKLGATSFWPPQTLRQAELRIPAIVNSNSTRW